MGLYGSEYWTYSLPKRVGPQKALELTQNALPLGTRKAKSLGYIDEILSDDYEVFLAQVMENAEALAASPQYATRLAEKLTIREQDETAKPLAAYRLAELKRMKANFSGKKAPGEVDYHQARYNFVHKIKPKLTSACCQAIQATYATLNREGLRLLPSSSGGTFERVDVPYALRPGSEERSKRSS